MTWSWLTPTYAICLAVGTGYTLISFLLGHVGGGGDHGMDAGGDGADVGGNAATVGSDHHLHFPLLSPVAIAVFLTAFGGGGLIGLQLLEDHHPAMSLAVAGGGGVAFGLSIAAAMAFVMRKTVATSHARESDVIGSDALVAVTIPPNGVGKIVYEAAGTRFTAPARSENGTEIRQNAKVVIRRKDGVVYFVDTR